MCVCVCVAAEHFPVGAFLCVSEDEESRCGCWAFVEEREEFSIGGDGDGMGGIAEGL